MYYTYDLAKARETLKKAGYPYWPPEPPLETPMSAYLVPATGELVGGLIIDAGAIYFGVKKRIS